MESLGRQECFPVLCSFVSLSEQFQHEKKAREKKKARKRKWVKLKTGTKCCQIGRHVSHYTEHTVLHAIFHLLPVTNQFSPYLETEETRMYIHRLLLKCVNDFGSLALEKRCRKASLKPSVLVSQWTFIFSLSIKESDKSVKYFF